MAPQNVERLRIILRFVLAAIYLAVGAFHLAAADKLVVIVPPIFPWPKALVILTGLCEVAGATGLTLPISRRLAGIMLAVYAVCVWPANIYQAFWHVPAPPLPDSWWYHGPRIAFQPVLVWWALFAGRLLDWPFKSRR